jgi:riboflavin synthase
VFTGIVEQPCPVVEVLPGEGLVTLAIDLAGLEGDPLVGPGDSVALNGVCLTVTALEGSVARFDVVPETLGLTTLGGLLPGSRVNVERALCFGDRLDGHLVQGHVEGTGEVLAAERSPGELRLSVGCGAEFAARTLQKGSITVDGVSLTVAELHDDHFVVALVPHTLERTTLGDRAPGDRVNLEPDMVGQWVLRLLRSDGALPPR